MGASDTTVVNYAWSYSALRNFETCPRRYYNYNVAKHVKEPEGPQLLEGKRLHEVFEARIKQAAPLPLGYGQYEGMLARFVGAAGVTYAEQKLAITSSFQPSAYFGKQVWFRTQVDAAKVRPDGVATIIDWKTGRPSMDMTQLQLMSAAMFIHQPAVMRVKAALVFLNHETAERAEFTREDQAEIWGEILPRVRAVEKARQTQEYPPIPSGLCKKYCAVTSCPYHGRGS